MCICVFSVKNPPWFDKALSAVTLRREELASISLDWQILETQSKQILETQSATNIWTLIPTNTQTIPHGHIQSSKLNSTMCFVCLILTSQNISRGAVIFVESQNISQLMDENFERAALMVFRQRLIELLLISRHSSLNNANVSHADVNSLSD